MERWNRLPLAAELVRTAEDLPCHALHCHAARALRDADSEIERLRRENEEYRRMFEVIDGGTSTVPDGS